MRTAQSPLGLLWRFGLGATGLTLLAFLLLAFAPFAATEEGSTRLALSLLHIPPVAGFLWTLHRVEKALG